MRRIRFCSSFGKVLSVLFAEPAKSTNPDLRGIGIPGRNGKLDMLKVVKLKPAGGPPLPAVIKKGSPPSHDREKHKKRRDKENEPAASRERAEGSEGVLPNHRPPTLYLSPLASPPSRA